jgi:formylmethanofuran dehydrogenase subunit C
MSLRLTQLVESTLPVEVEGLTPDWAQDKSIANIERFEAFCGNQRLPLAELFRIEGDPADGRFDFEGDLRNVHRLGAHMRNGRINVRGAAGRHIGAEMRGGEIHVDGDAGDWLGAQMRGGLIHVRGGVGNRVGGAYPGATRGMTGGTILVDGSAGTEAGAHMRRGVVAVAGDAGDLVGFNMLAGTIVVLGKCGARTGAGMRRGTICLFGPAPPLLPSFRYACTTRLPVLPLLLGDLRAKGFRINDALIDPKVELHSGDHLALGKGEILRSVAAG